MKNEHTIKVPRRRDVPETRLYSVIHKINDGSTRDTMILVPGGPGNDHSMYNVPNMSFVEALLPYINIILFDPRGCGVSEKSDIHYCTLNEYIDDVESVRAFYDIPPTQFVLFGASYGAICALGYATKYPSNLKKLILVCGAVNGDFIAQAKDNLLKIGTPEQQYQGNKILDGGLTDDPSEYATYYQTMGPLYSKSFKPDTPTPPLTNNDLTNYGFSDFLRKFDYRSSLKNISCPTLILAGESDWIADKSQSEALHHGLHNSKLITYEHCGHLIWVDQWEKSIADITNFLTS